MRCRSSVGCGYPWDVPNKPRTPIRNFRVNDETWREFGDEAGRRGENRAVAMRRMIRRYIRGEKI